MTTIQATKTDGNKVNFNFKLENGLPLKFVIAPEYKGGWDEKHQEYGIYIDLSPKEVLQTKNAEILKFHLINYELWFECENCYIAISLTKEALEYEKKNKMEIYFFNNQNKIIKTFGS